MKKGGGGGLSSNRPSVSRSEKSSLPRPWNNVGGIGSLVGAENSRAEEGFGSLYGTSSDPPDRSLPTRRTPTRQTDSLDRQIVCLRCDG